MIDRPHDSAAARPVGPNTSIRRKVAQGVGVATAVTALLLGLLSSAASAEAASQFPAVISLPDGFQPEGIEVGQGTTFYAGSLIDGAVYRGDLRTGRGQVLVPGVNGRAAFGLELDQYNRLFVADGPGGGARVFHATTGEELASYQFTPAGRGVIHDVHITPNAAYFTDSIRPVLYAVPIGRGGRLGGQASIRTIPLTGDIDYLVSGPACPGAPELNLNGLETSPDGRRLISVQFNTGLVFSINPTTGVTRQIDLNGASLECGNSLVRRGQTLYVTQSSVQQVSVVRLGSSYTSALLERTIADPDLDFPTASAIFGPFLYTANARFATEPTPQTPYHIVRLPAG